jgi:hypothetical protein
MASLNVMSHFVCWSAGAVREVNGRSNGGEAKLVMRCW